MVKKKSAKSQPVAASDASTGGDSRPKSSVYCDSVTTFYTKDGSEFKVLHPLLAKCPKLAGKIVASWSNRLNISLEVGHVVVNYLYTNRYEHIRPKGATDEERLHAEFATNIHVYAFSREMDFLPLQDLAKCEIERIGKLLSFPTIFNQVRLAYPHIPADDQWFIAYVQSGIVSLPQDLSIFSSQQTLTASDVLLQGLIRVYTQETSGKDLMESTTLASQDGFTLIMPKVAETDEGRLEDSQLQPEPETLVNEEFSEDSSDDNDRGKTSRKEVLLVAEPEPEPELKIPDAEPVTKDVEEQPQNDDDFWGSMTAKKDKKKKKESPPAVVEDPPPNDDDFWGSMTAKKDKKKKKESPPAVVEDPPPNDDDFWGSLGPKKDKKKKKNSQPAVVEDPTQNDDDVWGSMTSKKDKKKKASGLELTAEPEPVEVIGETNRIENPTCSQRSAHILGEGLDTCATCQDFVLKQAETIMMQRQEA